MLPWNARRSEAPSPRGTSVPLQLKGIEVEDIAGRPNLHFSLMRAHSTDTPTVFAVQSVFGDMFDDMRTAY